MENGTIDLNRGLLHIFDSDIYIGMTYEEFKNNFESYIKNICEFETSEGLNCKTITSIETSVYNIACFYIKIWFKENICYKIYMEPDCNNVIVTNSKDKKGIGYYQEKVIQNEKNIIEIFKQLYPDEIEIDDKLEGFFIKTDKYSLGSSIDRDCLKCTISLRSLN